MDIQDIIRAIESLQYYITDHADEESQADRLSAGDVFQSVRNGEVIEDYPTDHPYPSCLIYGLSSEGMPIHSVWAYNEESQWAVLVTVYRPDPTRWLNWRKRREDR